MRVEAVRVNEIVVLIDDVESERARSHSAPPLKVPLANGAAGLCTALVAARTGKLQCLKIAIAP